MIKILLGTPWYAWVALGYVLFRGIKATSDRVVHLPKLFIMPAILTALKYKIFVNLDWLLISVYIISMAVGGLLGFILSFKIKITVYHKTNSIGLKGEYVTLPILLAFFAVKYAFGFLKSSNPALPVVYALAESGLSGLLCGAFLGRSLCFLHRSLKG